MGKTVTHAQPSQARYHEMQDRQMCMCHSINALHGRRLLDGNRVLTIADWLADCTPRIAGAYYTRHTGNFSLPLVNLYLDTCLVELDTPHFHLAKATNVHHPTTLTRLLDHVLTHPGITDAAKTIAMRQGMILCSDQHATCIKHHNGRWWHVDSLRSSPTSIGPDSTIPPARS